MKPNIHLLLFTIGPVQTFIEHARKTRDLYVGSGLLSELCRKATKLLETKYNAEIIFPNIEKIESLPNRFLAKLETAEIKDVCIGLEEYIKEEFRQFTKDTLSSMKIILTNPCSFDLQVDQFLEIYWVALHVNDDNYQEQFKETEFYLGAVKNTRVFQQSTEPAGRKCSLCGQRNALLFYSKDNKADLLNPKTNLKKNYFVSESINLIKYTVATVNMNEGEGLCAICFTKRFVNLKPFPSTAEIASMGTLSKLEQDILKNYKKLFGLQFDEQLYFEENLTEDYFEKHSLPKDKLQPAQQLQKEIKDTAKNKNLKLSKYYALLMLDGDYMGKWLSGEYLVDTTKLYHFHKEFTKELGKYADDVGKIIKNPKGELVYAGGDDVLAFVNLDYLFKILKELRAKFPKFEEIKSISSTKNSTPSCGVVIAHYKTPLSEVMKWTREVERKAKREIDRDAFTIAVLRHSGEISQCGFKWIPDGTPTINIFSTILKFIQEDSIDIHLSTNFIRQLRLEFSRMMNKKGMLETVQSQEIDFKNIVTTEVKRLLNRSLEKFSGKPGENNGEYDQRKKEFLANLTDKIMLLFNYSENNMENFLSSLEILAFIKRESNGGQYDQE